MELFLPGAPHKLLATPYFKVKLCLLSEDQVSLCIWAWTGYNDFKEEKSGEISISSIDESSVVLAGRPQPCIVCALPPFCSPHLALHCPQLRTTPAVVPPSPCTMCLNLWSPGAPAAWPLCPLLSHNFSPLVPQSLRAAHHSLPGLQFSTSFPFPVLICFFWNDFLYSWCSSTPFTEPEWLPISKSHHSSPKALLHLLFLSFLTTSHLWSSRCHRSQHFHTLPHTGLVT